jgi:hypothetical protein
MTRFLLAGAAALGMVASAAMAQTSTSTSQTTTTTTPSAPVTISSGSTVGQSVTSDGVRTVTGGMSSKDSAGTASETTISNRTYPLSNMVTTTKKTTDIRNGVAVETETTTNAYPPGTATVPPVVTTTTKTSKVGAE